MPEGSGPVRPVKRRGPAAMHLLPTDPHDGGPATAAAVLASRTSGKQFPGMNLPFPSRASPVQHPDAAPRPQTDFGPAGADAELLRRMCAGDEAALGELHDRWSPLLYSLVLRIVGDGHDAEEVLEETFWQAWRQAGRYQDGRGSVSSWLTTIARSRALDRLRARRRRREESWDGAEETLASASADHDPHGPLEAMEAEERRAIIVRAVAQLPEQQRKTVELAYFGGMSQSEIAEQTGQPLGTVKTRARLALQKLREVLSVLREEER